MKFVKLFRNIYLISITYNNSTKYFDKKINFMNKSP